MKKIINLYISLFYIGYIKFAPGSIGSLASILILFPFFYFEIFNIFWLIFIFIIIFLFSLIFINLYSKYTKTHDSKIIVIDEFLGIYFILLFYEKIILINIYYTIISIFILFRFFDVIKIFPANIIDKKILNEYGVILDDIISAIYTVITIYFINALI